MVQALTRHQWADSVEVPLTLYHPLEVLWLSNFTLTALVSMEASDFIITLQTVLFVSTFWISFVRTSFVGMIVIFDFCTFIYFWDRFSECPIPNPTYMYTSTKNELVFHMRTKRLFTHTHTKQQQRPQRNIFIWRKSTTVVVSSQTAVFIEKKSRGKVFTLKMLKHTKIGLADSWVFFFILHVAIRKEYPLF